MWVVCRESRSAAAPWEAVYALFVRNRVMGAGAGKGGRDQNGAGSSAGFGH